MRLAVGGALAQREAQRMAAEKVAAIAEAQAAATTKMIMGGGMAAATNPLPLFISGRCGQTDVALLDADFVSTRAS
jgi:enhancing lycopene biosynthesis protein 2